MIIPTAQIKMLNRITDKVREKWKVMSDSFIGTVLMQLLVWVLIGTFFYVLGFIYDYFDLSRLHMWRFFRHIVLLLLIAWWGSVLIVMSRSKGTFRWVMFACWVYVTYYVITDLGFFR